MRFERLIVAVCAVWCFAVCFAGCAPDLGKEDYRQKIAEEVSLVKDNGEVLSVKAEELYSDNAINNFNRSDFECPTASNAYRYMAVFAKDEVTVEEFVIYMRSETDVTMEMSVYLGILTGDTETGTGTETDTETDTETGERPEQTTPYDELAKVDAVAEVTVVLKANQWTSVSVGKWRIAGAVGSSVVLEEGHCLLFRFNNNCVRYDADGKTVANVENKDLPARICFTAMLIRVGK